MDVGAPPDCTLCPLHETRKQVVRWRGTLEAEVLLVGEGPGQAEEDWPDGGSPFVGKSGRVLAMGLRKAGWRVPEDDRGRPLWDRTSLCVTGMVHCRPPGNAAPDAKCVKACAPYLLDIIAHMPNLRVVVGLGNAALSYWTGRKGITSRMGVPIGIEVPDYAGEEV